MKSRYMPILYVGMVFAAFAAGFHALDRLGRSLLRNPSKVQSVSVTPSKIPETALSETTLSDIRKSLEKQEYHISFDEQKKKLQSPNRNNNIRAYYEPGKLTVQTRVDTTGQGFKFEMINEGVFADGKLLYIPQVNAKAQHRENKLQITHSAFTEKFINNEDGLRQNFIIENAPENTRQLQVKISVKGLQVTQSSGNELRFYSKTSDGETRNELVYSDLKCWDANKRPLNATLAYVNNRIQISVDVAGAAYPVTIDPIIANGTPQNANKILEINQSNMWLGFSVSSAGDVNGDGYSDIIVGAPQYDLGQDGEGAAFIYPGSAAGILLGAVTLQCDQAGAQMGYTVSTAGDFNGDGYSDVLVGIPYYDTNSGVVNDAGEARLYLGSAQGISAASVPTPFHISQSEAYMGISIAAAGDIDADGYSDIVIGAHQCNAGQINEGIAFVCYGSLDGSAKSQTLEANQPNARFGYSVAGAGDVDGDGFGDVIVGARYYTNGQGQDAEGAAFIYRGSANGLLKDNPVIIEGNQYNAAMGNKVSSAGDVNGDGYSDILISAYLKDGLFTDEGQVQLHYGSSTGIDPQKYDIFSGGHQNDHMGSSISCAGDVNGDGYADILLGAEYYDNGQFNEGAVFVHNGSKYGIVDEPASTLESNQANGWFGTAVASAGDVNGDGYSDILVGCYTFDNGQTDEGHVFVYHGGAEGIGTKDATTITNNKTSAQMGLSLARAGDVNADGYGDIIVGAPTYDNGQSNEGIAFVYYGNTNGLVTATYHLLQKDQANAAFGGSVAGAGDINGDGYDDVLVGAKEFTLGENHEGIVFAYLGSSSGINMAIAPIIIQSDRADADFGAAVAGAGDINRDGYGDVVIGAPAYSLSGTIFICYGGPNGPSGQFAMSGYQDNSHFGEAISAAGDVNGDGYGDIIVGAWSASLGEQNEGAAYIFHGTSAGLDFQSQKILESNQANAKFGASVACAGDVNGDGFSDVIVGGNLLDHPEVNEGVAVVYYGTANGISIAAPAAPTFLEINTIGAYFGSSVSSAGDVNGDGYSDVIVGAYNFANNQNGAGKAFVFHGSPSGTKTASSFSIEGEETTAYLGRSVSGAGDVNGDGYSDVLVGVPGYNNGQYADAGKVSLFYGNNGIGLRSNVRLYNNDVSTPINHNNFNMPDFGVGLFAKSFLGVNEGKLVIETKGTGIPFSKVGPNPITNSTLYTSIFPTSDNLSATGTELQWVTAKQGISTKLRVRVRYSPVLALTGQMYGPWRYLQSQLAGYNNAPVPEEAMAETIKRKADAGMESQGISIVPYPNPVSDKLFIKAENMEHIHSVRLLTATGKLIHQSQNAAAPIDVRSLAPGMYVLLITRQDGSQSSHKVIVKK